MHAVLPGGGGEGGGGLELAPLCMKPSYIATYCMYIYSIRKGQIRVLWFCLSTSKELPGSHFHGHNNN